MIADASGLSMAATRRLQLAAESGRSLALLARPPGERHELSVATTRWLVGWQPTRLGRPRWSIELFRCKGVQAGGICSTVNLIAGIWSGIVTRVLSLYLPMWPIDRVKRHHRRHTTHRCGRSRPREVDPYPILLVAYQRGQCVVAARCQLAKKAGIRCGMSLTHARAFLPHGKVSIEPVNPEQDNQALHTLARWASRFSPTVAVDAPDGLLIDITGCQRVFKGERRLIHQLTVRSNG